MQKNIKTSFFQIKSYNHPNLDNKKESKRKKRERENERKRINFSIEFYSVFLFCAENTYPICVMICLN